MLCLFNTLTHVVYGIWPETHFFSEHAHCANFINFTLAFVSRQAAEVSWEMLGPVVFCVQTSGSVKRKQGEMQGIEESFYNVKKTALEFKEILQTFRNMIWSNLGP